MQVKYLIGPVTELVAVFFGFINYRKLDKKLSLLFYFVCFGFSIDLITNILIEGFGLKNTLVFLHLYVPLEFLLLGFTYLYALRGYFNTKFLLVIIVGFEFYCLINPIFFQNINEYTHARSISSLLLILLSILYFHKVVIEAKIESLSKEPMIWINTAVLIYFSGNLFYNVLFSFILDYSREFSKMTTYYFVVLTAFFYLLIAIGFWKVGKQQSLKA